MLQKAQAVLILMICAYCVRSTPCAGASLVAVTGFGGVTTERAQDWDGQTVGISASLMKALEVETGFFFNTVQQELDWYGNVSLRLQSPAALSEWFAPYLLFGIGKYNTQSTNSAGFGLALNILRLDYRYIWVEQTRRGINRAYVGLEFDLKGIGRTP